VSEWVLFPEESRAGPAHAAEYDAIAARAASAPRRGPGQPVQFRLLGNQRATDRATAPASAQAKTPTASPADTERCAPEPGGLEQTLWALGALAVTLVAGMALGSSWGAFALGFLVLQVGAVPPRPALVQVLILIATFCHQRSPRSDNALNLLGAEHASSAAVCSVWSATSFTLPIGGRRLAVRAEWVQWGLVGLGVAASAVQAAVL
jgi:hypothetical protein